MQVLLQESFKRRSRAGLFFFPFFIASVGAADNRRVLTWFFLGSVSRTSCIIEGRGCLRYILRDMFASDGAVLA